MSRQPKLSDFKGQMFLLLMVLISLTSCNTVQKETQIVVKPVDNGMGIPGILVIHKYNEENKSFEALHLGPDEIVNVSEDDVSGAAFVTRTSMLELLVKEAALADYATQNPESIQKLNELMKENENRLKPRIK